MHTCRMTQQKPETACSRSSRHGPEHPVACMADLADVLGRYEALGERKVARVHLSVKIRYSASVLIMRYREGGVTSRNCFIRFMTAATLPNGHTSLDSSSFQVGPQSWAFPARLCVGSMGGLVSTAGAGDAGVCPRAVSALNVSALARERTRPL